MKMSLLEGWRGRILVAEQAYTVVLKYFFVFVFFPQSSMLFKYAIKPICTVPLFSSMMLSGEKAGTTNREEDTNHQLQ